MNLGGIFKSTVGAVAGAGKGLVEAVPAIVTHTAQGASSPPALPDLPAAISQAAQTPHPDGGTVLDHYVQAGAAVVLGAVMPHVPILPTGVKTAISAGLVAFALTRVNAAVAHMESAYVAPAAVAPVTTPASPAPA